MTAASATYTVEAYNLSQASENKIHDDTVAQKLGFTGGLVPGVEVFAYMTHPVVAKWGRAWLERGQMQARFLKPLYDGRMAEVSADPGDARDTLALTIESDAVRCASGTFCSACSTVLIGTLARSGHCVARVLQFAT